MRQLNPLIVLVTYNRPDHTRRVLEAMRQEGVREFTIVMDAAANAEDAAAQEQLLDLYGKIDWAEHHLRRRPRNTGLAHSIVESATTGLFEADSIIILEDDCVPLPGFFDFMRQGLERYADLPKVRSLCGYQFPFVEDSGLALTGMALHRFTPWGWATWSDRWKDYSPDLKSLVEGISRSGQFALMGEDLKRYCTEDYYLDGKADIWSLNWVLQHYLTDTYAVFPSRSLIENIGFDGTGVHSIRTQAFEVHHQNAPHHVPITLPAHPELNREAVRKIDDYLDQHSRKVMVRLPRLV